MNHDRLPSASPADAAKPGIRERYRRFAAPRPDGLPPVRLLVAFFALIALVGIVLVGLGVSGTSSGEFYHYIATGHDPQLIVGEPEAIRSDEWNVGVPWTISQLQQGLPTTNHAFPGGMDAALPFGLPDRELAIALQPQELGYLFLDANHATAWKWWVPGLALIVASFTLMVTLLPRRPLVAAGLSIAFYFSPFFQWWYQTSTLWPIVWGAVTISAIVWAARSSGARTRLVFAAIACYATAVMAIGVYAPFIIPIVYVVAFFAIGQIVRELRTGARWRDLAIRMLPIIGAGAIAGAVVLAWLQSKSAAVAGFLATVYPGQRLTPPGSGSLLGLARTFGFSFSQALEDAGGFLGVNSSEASTFLLLGVFLAPVGIWVVVTRARGRVLLPWTTIGLIAVLLFFLAYMFVPGWEGLAHLIFLDRTTADRARIGFGFASFVLIGSIARDLDEDQSPAPRWLSWSSSGAFAASQIALAAAVWLVLGSSRLWQGSSLWPAFMIVSAAAIYFFARRQPLAGTAAFLAVSIASSVAVNPLYEGVLDLRKTAVSREIVHLYAKDPKRWLGVGGILESSLLLESGVQGYNGTQGVPSRKMWKQVDPTGKYQNQWNRLAEIVWAPGTGEPRISNPAEDIIRSTFDACSTFAQKNVGYVLSDRTLGSPCLQLVRSFRVPKTVLEIYKVIPRH